MERKIVISEAYATGDLTENLERAKLVDGENTIFHDAEGRKLVALVSKGVISEWIAYDDDGTEVPTVTVRQPAVEPKRKGPKPNKAVGWYVVCACFPSGDRCWMVRWF